MKKTITVSIAVISLAAPAKSRKPNIVHIMCDDHSLQTISAYGHPLSRIAPTPNIDRLAASGMLFGRAFVENSLSTPSRACLMTGLYSHQNGQRALGAGIDTTKVFFSELLRDAGYQTGVVGKWHLQCEPKGFDYYCVLNDQGDYYNPEFKTPESRGAYLREEGYATKLITDHSIEFLEKRDAGKPFCLLVHHKAPHRNWMPEGKYLNLYDDVEFPLPANFRDDYSTRCDAARSQEMSVANDMTLIYDLKATELRTVPPYDGEWNIATAVSDLERLTPEQLRVWTEAYAPRNAKFIADGLGGEELVRWKYNNYLRDYLRCIKTIDDEVGRLLDWLEREGLRENTMVVYTSDQGFYMGEHGWFDKRFMYEESFGTPLIVSYPGVVRHGVCNALVQNLDFAPTYLAVAGVSKPEAMSGRSLEPLFDGAVPDDWREYLYYHYYDYPAIHRVRRHEGVRDKRYKLIRFYGRGFGKEAGCDADCAELYDLESDPSEMNNVYGDPAFAPVAARLQGALDRFRSELKTDEP
ncbi:MAG: sulfatase [Prevotellaceae bacterium]|jgi:arylsulfatase A-like enzyme|nr:sulfatase [Prevotellaceae bacterium]